MSHSIENCVWEKRWNQAIKLMEDCDSDQIPIYCHADNCEEVTIEDSSGGSSWNSCVYCEEDICEDCIKKHEEICKNKKIKI